MVTDLDARILMDIGQLPAADWDAGRPGEAEGWAYYRACGGPVAVVMDYDGLVLGAPLFEMEYRLDTPFQGRAGDIARRLAGLMVWRLLGIGSALAERCHVAARPGLTPAQRKLALDALLALLDYARPRTLDRQPVDVGAKLAGVLAFAAPDLERRGIRVTIQAPSGSFIIQADGGRLHQVFLNIILNAMDAMPGGGLLTCRVEQSGERVVFSIADTGPASIHRCAAACSNRS
ncbi:hypothetical protein GCM10011317_37640 [Niveispirillum cyanobacteriorum]|nr:ATP-binding protein [Niveispirillum cyanobacteriorum]GGE77046.1 hypothetical protein GCM10011317_37640 [Niveispirillum cyanobacteriorum]